MKTRKSSIAQKLMVMGASVALGASLFTASLASAEKNERYDKKPSFEFGLIADIQYCDCDTQGVRFYRNSIEKLQAATAELNRHDLAFTIQTGDLIDRNVDSFNTILPYFNQIQGKRYHTLGNHDFPVTTDEVADILDMPNQYYDFAKKGYRFVVLDTNDRSLYAHKQGSAQYQQSEQMYNQLMATGAANAQTWNGGVGPEQLDWLKKVLEESKKKHEKVIVIGHHPVYPANEHNAWNDTEIVKVLERAGNVVAYFNGHNHEGNFAEKNGITYLNFRGMLDTADTSAFSVIEAYKDRLEIDGFGREPDRTIWIHQDQENKGKHRDSEHAYNDQVKKARN
ncbi:metallophosphoesterase [Bacillus sp. V5-8f]|uniref:metallophosphoesterase n=1 Tax=Bacillus sp. V5-8f TaxID=2053044 RepID=UPI000C758584|nr:metallophosphoesterase [Bacillus sp. V5-8f]PLT35226.1 phosphatase [Bacillus sp. V5-8f]